MLDWLLTLPAYRQLPQAVEDSVRQRLEVLRTLSQPAIEGLAKGSHEELSLAGHKVQRLTWHERKEDGSHWVVVQVWGTGFILGAFILAQSGFSSSSGTRRELGQQELFEGGFD